MAERKTHAQFVSEVRDMPIEVIGVYGKNNRSPMVFGCKECGHEWTSNPHSIVRGQLCPECARKRGANKNRRKNKVIEDHGDWLMVETSSHGHMFATMKIDTMDAARIGMIGRARHHRGCAYVGMNKRQVAVHRIITDAAIGMDVDHINHDTCDNRRANLRVCTHGENLRNMKKRKDNTSGITGVTWDKKRAVWIAQLSFHGKHVYLGEFKEKDRAIEARRNGERKYYGEFAYENSKV